MPTPRHTKYTFHIQLMCLVWDQNAFIEWFDYEILSQSNSRSRKINLHDGAFGRGHHWWTKKASRSRPNHLTLDRNEGPSSSYCRWFISLVVSIKSVYTMFAIGINYCG